MLYSSNLETQQRHHLQTTMDNYRNMSDSPEDHTPEFPDFPYPGHFDDAMIHFSDDVIDPALQPPQHEEGSSHDDRSMIPNNEPEQEESAENSAESVGGQKDKEVEQEIREESKEGDKNEGPAAEVEVEVESKPKPKRAPEDPVVKKKNGMYITLKIAEQQVLISYRRNSSKEE